jgi:hypothetical protein
MIEIDTVAFNNPGKVSVVSTTPCMVATRKSKFAGSTIEQKYLKEIWPTEWASGMLPRFPASTRVIPIVTLHLNYPEFQLQAPLGCVLYVHDAVQTVGQLFDALQELFSFPVGLSLWQLWLPPQQDPLFAAAVTDIALKSLAGYALPIATVQTVAKTVLMPLCLASSERDVLPPEFAAALWRCRNSLLPKPVEDMMSRDKAIVILMGFLNYLQLDPLPDQDEKFEQWWKTDAYKYTSTHIFMSLLLNYYIFAGGERALKYAKKYRPVIDMMLNVDTLEFSCMWVNDTHDYCSRKYYTQFARDMLPLVGGMMAFGLNFKDPMSGMGHATIVIVNTTLTPHTVELFDPYGATRDFKSAEVYDAVFNWFRLDDGAEWEFHRPSALCLRGPQASEDLYSPNIGTCTMWSIWFMQFRLWGKPDASSKSLLDFGLVLLKKYFPGSAVGMFIYEFARRVFRFAAEEYENFLEGGPEADMPEEPAEDDEHAISEMDLLRLNKYGVAPLTESMPQGTCTTVRARDVHMVCAADKAAVSPPDGFVALTDVQVTTTRVYDNVTLFVRPDTPLKALPSLLSGAVMKEQVSVVLEADDDTLYIPRKTRWSVARMNGYIACGVTRLGLAGVTVRALTSRVHVSITTTPAEWISLRNLRILTALDECYDAADAADAATASATATQAPPALAQ